MALFAYSLHLDAAQEVQVPPVISSATGTGFAVFDSVAQTLSYEINVSGLDWGPFLGFPAQTPATADNVNGDHFHSGARGANGGVIFDWRTDDDFAFTVESNGSVTVRGRWETTDTSPITAFAAIFGAGTVGNDIGIYANIHSVGFPAGEIRGQFVGMATEGGDILNGTAGRDYLVGLAGNDVYTVTAGDIVIEQAGGGTDTINSSTVDVSIQALTNVENAQVLGSLALDVTGNNGNNTLAGSNNTAANVLTGLGGSDSYFVGAGDTIVEAPNAGSDTVISSTISLDLANFANVENVQLTGSAALAATGNNGNNTLNGAANTGSNVLTGLGGNDSYIIAGSNQTFDPLDIVVEAVDGGIDTVIASDQGVNLLDFRNCENVTLTGTLALSAVGNDGANTLSGELNTAANSLRGKDLNDTYFVGVGDFVVESAGGISGIDTVNSKAVSIDLGSVTFANCENAVLNGGLALSATGTAGANSLFGSTNTAANVLIGLGGDDSYNIGVGDNVVEGAGAGIDTIVTAALSINLASFLNVENVTLAGALALSATGDAGNNALSGAANTAANTLIGLGGNDFYIVGAGDKITEAAGGGTDTVNSTAISLDLASFANVENVLLTGVVALNATGNSGANTITGNSAANTLAGLGGADIFVFRTALGTIDAITDLSVVDDTIQLENSVFTALTTGGTLAAAAFVIGAAATSADHRIVYNQATGGLFYDADGIGGTAQQQFASVSAGLAMTNADFVVI